MFIRLREELQLDDAKISIWPNRAMGHHQAFAEVSKPVKQDKMSRAFPWGELLISKSVFGGYKLEFQCLLRLRTRRLLYEYCSARREIVGGGEGVIESCLVAYRISLCDCLVPSGGEPLHAVSHCVCRWTRGPCRGSEMSGELRERSVPMRAGSFQRMRRCLAGWDPF